jgi:hypothetical protein
MTHGTDGGGGNEGYGVLSDCVFGGTPAVAGSTTSCALTSAWGVNAGYEHFWTPALHSDIYGGYAVVQYGGQANTQLCTAEGAGLPGAGCNNNWSTWGIGSRTQWDVTKTFYLGVEVMYQQLDTARTATGLLPAGSALAVASSGAGAATQISNQNNWNFTVRAHRDFLP